MKVGTPYLKPALHVGIGQAKGILEAVRNVVLKWSLKLEEDGILGEGMTFSNKEKQTASATTYHIENFFAQVSHSQIQQNPVNSSQSMLIKNFDLNELGQFLTTLNQSLDKLNLSPQRRAELQAEIETIQSQTLSPKPKHSIIRECLNSIRAILENAAGSVAGDLIIKMGSLLG